MIVPRARYLAVKETSEICENRLYPGILRRYSQSLLDRAQAARSELESVVAAFRRLKAGGVSGDASMPSQHTRVVSELNRLNLEIPRLQKEVASATDRMTRTVRSIHRDLDHYKDLQKVKSYHPPSASQEQPEQPQAQAQRRQEQWWQEQQRQEQWRREQQRQGQQRQSIKDYYKILQVDPCAEPEVIAGAYRRLAAKYHPDVYKGRDANQKMQLINEAYTVLSDPVKRKNYDELRARQVW